MPAIGDIASQIFQGGRDVLLGEQRRPDPGAYQIPGVADIRSGLGGLGAEAAGRMGPGLATAPEEEWRRRQAALANQLAAYASGEVRGPGELAAQRQGQQALAAQLAMAGGARGMGANAARARLAGQGAMMQTDLAGQAAAARQQDIMQARGALAQLAAQGRAADQATAQAQMQGQLAAQAQQDATRLAVYQQLLQAGLTEQQARAQLDRMAFETQRQGMLPALLGAGVQIAAAKAGGG